MYRYITIVYHLAWHLQPEELLHYICMLFARNRNCIRSDTRSFPYDSIVNVKHVPSSKTQDAYVCIPAQPVENSGRTHSRYCAVLNPRSRIFLSSFPPFFSFNRWRMACLIEPVTCASSYVMIAVMAKPPKAENVTGKSEICFRVSV